MKINIIQLGKNQYKTKPDNIYYDINIQYLIEKQTEIEESFEGRHLHCIDVFTPLVNNIYDISNFTCDNSL